MVGDRRVSNVAARTARHMASDTTVALHEANGFGLIAAVLRMARKAARPVKIGLLIRRRRNVRIVATRAGHLAFAAKIATTLFHVFELPDRFLVSRQIRMFDKNAHHMGQRKSRPKIVHRPAIMNRARFADQMTLPANVLLQFDIEVLRIDDARVFPHRTGMNRPLGHMQFTRTMTTLTADR